MLKLVWCSQLQMFGVSLSGGDNECRSPVRTDGHPFKACREDRQKGGLERATGII